MTDTSAGDTGDRPHDGSPPGLDAPLEDQPGFDELLEYLRAERGFDLTRYKRPSVGRRIARRVQETGCDSVSAYHEHLELHPEEFENLFDTILINVTDFFRDPPAWEHLAQNLLPQVVASSGDDSQIRVWSAGCSSGQEAYSIAMILAEHLGEDVFRHRVKIYATDIDEPALAQARSGIYSGREVSSLSPERVGRFFQPVTGGQRFNPELRRNLVFGRLDLTRDAPISRLDLLCCRNTLMYFNAELQAMAVSRFHYAMRDSGILFLGRAETLLTHQSLFKPADGGHRLFRRVPGVDSGEVVPGLVHRRAPGHDHGGDPTLEGRAAASSPVAMLVVDVDGRLVGANAAARASFGISSSDLDRPFAHMEISYRPVELRSMIETAYAQSAPCERRGVGRVLGDGVTQYLDVIVAPLPGDSGEPLGVSISFVDATETVELRDELTHTQEELQTNNEELQSTNEELQTSNEELQSTNEELQTTNEELQSTNEELQTTNEELRSANEQLIEMTGEAKLDSDRLDHGQLVLQTVLDGMAQPLAVLDDHLDVIVWNEAMGELMDRPAGEAVGRSFPSLDLDLPMPELVRPLHDAVAGRPTTLEVATGSQTTGSHRYRISISPAALGTGSPGVVVVMTRLEER